eukprot:scaffold368_cov258-Pinguiococcus_pyrenoidosus.AAC.23
MFEKLLWISCYMLVGAARGCSSVGEAQEKYADQLEALISELVGAVSKRYDLTFDAGVPERLAAYTDVVSTFPCGVKEFEWRNGTQRSRPASPASCSRSRLCLICCCTRRVLLGARQAIREGGRLRGSRRMPLAYGIASRAGTAGQNRFRPS